MTWGVQTDRLDLTDLLEVSDLLLGGRAFRFQVAGWSMAPVLRRGDQITVEPASPAHLRVGDLVLFHRKGKLICHRLVARQQTEAGLQLFTKGDAMTACDAPLQPEQILGRVVEAKPSRRWVGSLSRRVDGYQERLKNSVARLLLPLQAVQPYRLVMRSLLSRCVAYYIGIPEGRKWFRYHRIDNPCFPGTPGKHHRFHLVAKLAGVCVGSARVEPGADGLWLQALYVRIPYRGLGVASHLVELAATVAGRNNAPALLASIEPVNTAGLRLFTKMGFHSTSGQYNGPMCLRRNC